MSFRKLYDFLDELQDNNSKEWMDDHRKHYVELREWFISWLNDMNAQLANLDKEYTWTEGRKSMNRINNNLLFHPNKPIYKDHFAAGLDHASKQGDFYMQIGPKCSLLAGGYWKPEMKLLTSIREAIDYNGEELMAILDKPSFKKTFGDMVNDDPLKTAPKGFPKDHKYINLLRHRTFAVSYDLSDDAVLGENFEQLVIDVYKEMLPFRRYLNKAITV